MENSFRTLLFELFVAPVQGVWHGVTQRKIEKPRMVPRAPLSREHGNLAWELEKESWRAPHPLPGEVPPK